MCGCNIKLLSDGFTGNDLLQDESLRRTLSEYKMISKTGFNSGRVLPVLQYAWCLDAAQFQKTFANVGVTVNQSDLPALAQVIENGQDRDGTLTNDAGVKIYIDAMKMVREMKFTPEQIQNASCTIQFVP